MTGSVPFSIGAEVLCDDEVCGELLHVVVDPLARAVTHLIVEPKHRSGLGRLVPVNLVESSGEQIRLRCGADDFAKFPDAEETDFLLGLGAGLGYEPGQVAAWPYYGLEQDLGLGNVNLPVVHDRLPLGEVAVRRGEQVHATDGNIGQVRGLVIDPGDHHVTHVLLQEGHLWGRKEVAIPISSVTTMADGIRLRLSKDEVGDLPAIGIAHPDW